MKPRLRIQSDGTFEIENVDLLSYTYFPLTNFHSVKSVITPRMGGSMANNQNTFFLAPTSNEDSHGSLINRNFYVKVNDEFVWSISGNTAYQTINRDKVKLIGDFLSHKIIRENEFFVCVIESFVPLKASSEELHKITFTSKKDNLKIKPVAAIPLYNRSADNQRDHRHVTSLLNNARILSNGMINKPTFSFDERGHLLNKMEYGVFVSSDVLIKQIWPIQEEFIGEGGSYLLPKVVDFEMHSRHQVGEVVSGYELLGGFEFETLHVSKGESKEFVISLIMDEQEEKLLDVSNQISKEYFQSELNKMHEGWKNELNKLQFIYPDDQLNGWLKWTTLQPILRRIYGNSFMPHHDYGKGGKGWRDLWQDALALILLDPKQVKEMLLNNFRGVRIDGSNATIIGESLGEFKADRNNISRVWMDHGSWPLLTVLLYVNQSGDKDFLKQDQVYFNDQFKHYTKKVNDNFEEDHLLRSTTKQIYSGSVMEHLIIQNLIPFFNVGNHNNLLLEDADWNDGLDMAHNNGESVAFTSLYGSNLKELGTLLLEVSDVFEGRIELLSELDELIKFDKLDDIEEKRQALNEYFERVSTSVSGHKTQYNLKDLSTLLMEKGEYLLQQVRNNEWLQGKEYSWFNGYYDDDGQRVDDTEKQHMTLTGQVFAIYGGSATTEQIKDIVKSADALLLDESVGGYRLNTNFHEVKTNLGRLFGFGYGHKENGAMFSHMAVMYANALYKRGFVKEGYKVLKHIYEYASSIGKSKMYPGIPEYFDQHGRGMYPYLTGSASWLILTHVVEIFGVKGYLGKQTFEPKLLLEQFNDGKASIITSISGKPTTITYENPDNMEYGSYDIIEIYDGSKRIDFEYSDGKATLEEPINEQNVRVVLGKK